MPVYHQMGHHSDSLLRDPQLNSFKGAILSPVNEDRESILKIINRYRNNPDFETIFDPQIYYPRTPRERLRTWEYFPSNYSTLDYSTDAGWQTLMSDIKKMLSDLRPNAVCAPAIVPRAYSNEYFGLTTEVANRFAEELADLDISVLQTIIVDYSTLADFERVMSIASIVTGSDVNRCYVFFTGASELKDRTEIADEDGIKGGMLLIDQLKNNGFDVLMGFCSSDILLWKTAGATSCASGKFWNLRRFNSQRWEESIDNGGGPLPYFFEEDFIAFLRESDFIRTQEKRSQASLDNPFYPIIESKIESGESWVAESWRQFLYWFADIETRINNQSVNVNRLLRAAEKNWEWIEDNDIILEERRNDGRWLRHWLRAISEYKSPW